MSASDCNVPSIQSRPYLSGPQIAFMHISSRGVGGASADVLVSLPFPCNSFFLVAEGSGGTPAGANTVFFHLKALNKNYVGNSITETGFEDWIAMTAAQLSGVNYRTFIRFKEKINQFYLDIGQEGGAKTDLVIACCADDAIVVSGGMWT
jgi:hypothetical protein